MQVLVSALPYFCYAAFSTVRFPPSYAWANNSQCVIMAEFTLTTEKDQDLTIVEFTGAVTGDTIVNALKRFYDSTITTNALWDFSACDVNALSYEDMLQLIETTKAYAHRRPNGKSAFVGTGDLAYGLGRMYSTMTAFSAHPIKSAIFKNRDDAMAWLKR